MPRHDDGVGAFRVFPAVAHVQSVALGCRPHGARRGVPLTSVKVPHLPPTPTYKLNVNGNGNVGVRGDPCLGAEDTFLA